MAQNDSFTRTQLRSTQISGEDYADIGLRTFTLANNTESNIYFTIEGAQIDGSPQLRKPIFDTVCTEIQNITNCTIVTGSSVAGVICNRSATATFNLYFATTNTPKEDLEFRATNPLIYSLGDITASGSVLGVTCTIIE